MTNVSGSAVQLCNASFSNTAYQIPGGLFDSNKIFWFKRTDSSQFICEIYTGTTKTIDGTSTVFNLAPNSTVGIWYDGSGYFIISFASL